MTQAMLIIFVILLSTNYSVISESIGRVLEELEVTPECKQQLTDVLNNFSFDYNSWALRMYDAGSKIPTGMLSANFGELGNFQQCIDIQVMGTTSEPILGKYCLGSLLPFFDPKAEKVLFHRNLLSLPVFQTWALCLPDKCTAADADVIGSTMLNRIFESTNTSGTFLQNNTLSVQFSDMFCQTVKDTDPKLTTGAKITIAILLLLVSFVFGGTLCEIYTGDSCPFLLQNFSLIYNSRKIFKTTPSTGDFPFLNGIKVLCTAWVVLAHQYSFMPVSAPANFSYLIPWMNHRWYIFIIGGFLCMDTFFTIGGVLLAYNFLKLQYHGKPHNPFVQILGRYFRLTPALALLVLVHTTLLNHAASGPRWPVIENIVQKHCQGYNGWRVFSFIQNYVSTADEICLGQTWYLNVDMQMYAIIHLALFFLWKNRKVFFNVLYICMVLSIGVVFHTAWKHKIPALPFAHGKMHLFLEHFLTVTHTHVFSWLLGFLLGSLLFKVKVLHRPVILKKSTIIIAWILCILSLYGCITLEHYTLREPVHKHRWANAIHLTLVRPVWVTANAWVILACSSGHGGYVNDVLSHPIFSILNNFAYCVYLVHLSLLTVLAASKKAPTYFTDFEMIYDFWGTFCTSLGLAAILVFLIDTPTGGMMEIIFGKRKKKMM